MDPLIYMTLKDCSGTIFTLDLRRKAALFNIPPPRLTVSSPYGRYSKQQLDMRRKAEILRYNSTAQASQTNSLTKKQSFAQLVTGKNIMGISESSLSKCSSSTIVSLSSKPTWTTACDVPGPPMILQFDSSIPVYNFGNDVRTYAISPMSSAQWNSLTRDELAFVETLSHMFETDQSTSVREERTMGIGSLVFSSFASLNTLFYIPSIQSPLGLFVNFVYGYGRSQNGVYIPPSIFNVQQDNTLTLRVTGVQLLVRFNGEPIILDPLPTISYDTVDLLLNCNQFQTISPQIKRKQGQYYGIQYVGMVKIEHIYLPASPTFVYDFQLVVNYTYDHQYIKHFDFFLSGVFPNLSQINQSVSINGMKFNPIFPPPYRSASFQQYA